MEKEIIKQYNNVPVPVAAKYLDKSIPYVYSILQQHIAPFGIATQCNGGKWSYHISPGGLIAYQEGTGVPRRADTVRVYVYVKDDAEFRKSHIQQMAADELHDLNSSDGFIGIIIPKNDMYGTKLPDTL